MKIAVLFPRSRISAWSLCDGVVNTLRRMGHKVLPVEIPQIIGAIDELRFEALKARLPKISELGKQDAILLSAPEHIGPWIDAIYGKYEWKHEVTCPKLAWYHESFFREDFTIDFDTVSYWADEHFFPAIQDAEFFDQESFAKGRAHYLPFGVDTDIFKPFQNYSGSIEEHNFLLKEKVWPIAFVGTMYDKRQAFLNALSKHDHPPIRFGTVTVEDLSGYCAEESARRLAANYRQVGVFFNMPALSRLLVTKVYEVMACGTFILSPQLPADRGMHKNLELFQTGHHLVYYRSSNLPYVAQLLREFSSPEKLATREEIAAEGCREVHEKHSLEKRLETILSKIGVKETVQ